MGDVVSVPFAVLDRMGRREPVASVVVKETDQQAWHSRPRVVHVGVVVSLQPCLHPFPKFARYDCFVLAGIDLPLVLDFPKIDPAPEDFVQGTARIDGAPRLATCWGQPIFAPNAGPF